MTTARRFRQFWPGLLASLSLVLLGLLLASLWPTEPARADSPLPTLTFTSTLPNGVAAGDVTSSTAVLWTRSNTTGVITFALAADVVPNAVVFFTRTVVDPMQPVTVSLTGLLPQVSYRYRATNRSGEFVNGRFVTAAQAGEKRGLRFGVSGDGRGELTPFVALGNAPERQLNFFLELGDTVYADVPSPALPISRTNTLAEFRIKHSEVYSARLGLNLWADLRGSTAILATPDDHEVINDFAGGAPVSSDPRFPETSGRINATQRFVNGMEAFQAFNPLRAEFYGSVGGDGRMDQQRKFYRYQRYGADAALFLLDQRSFRDQPIPPANFANLLDVVRFLNATFSAGRTILGDQQRLDLEHDLLDAQNRGITWKFVALPEPIQNLGPANAEDRFEGYAAERTQLLKFINDNQIDNVVFIAADIHGTLINNLTYQNGIGQPQQPTNAFEVTTGPVAYAAPFGPTIVTLAGQLGLITPTAQALYNALPVQNDVDDLVNDKDDFVKQAVNRQLAQFSYDPLGLAGSRINAQLVQGDYLAVHTYGWTEFEIGAASQVLTVTTYGIPTYTATDLADNPSTVVNRTPTIVSQFVVTPTVAQQETKTYLPVVQR